MIPCRAGTRASPDRAQARSWIGLLREHIAKEDDCLATVVHRAFSDEDARRLTQSLDEIDREIGERTSERFAAIVETLGRSTATVVR